MFQKGIRSGSLDRFRERIVAEQDRMGRDQGILY